MKKVKRSFRYYYLRTIRLRATSNEIARGFAFGVFWGMFPLPGLQMAIAIFTAVLFRSSKIAAAAGTWLTNPLTTIPFTALNFQVGQWVLGWNLSETITPNTFSFTTMMAAGDDLIISYLMGCFVVGAIGAVMAYLVGVPLITYWRKRAARRRSRL